ncbi:MAG: HAD family phosphatase [Erysipelotrichaceae bacterium]|nr:HAD family phosphatase [Erysipelotrichaceae bacterium]
MIKAVLFDLDGTLVDSEKYYKIAWDKTIEYFGHILSEEETLLIPSSCRDYKIEFFKKMFNGKYTVDEIIDKRIKIYDEMMIGKTLEATKGAKESLAYLKEKGIEVAVVTASKVSAAKRKLSEAGLDDEFEHIISASEMVKLGKPWPDCYLYACKQLNLDPSECAVVEDSYNGVKSAYDAGCTVYRVANDYKVMEKEKELIKGLINNLFELSKYI